MSITKAGRVTAPGAPGIHLASAHGGLASACLTAPDKSLDVEGQSRQILETIDDLLAEVGGDPRQIVMAQVWLLSIDDAEDFARAWNDWLGDRPVPALSVVQASAASRSSQVEIRAYAATLE